MTLAQLVERLAVDAQRRGRPRLEALQADLDAAAIAVAVFIRVDARDGLVDLLDQLALAVAVAQLERHVGLLAGAVVRIREHGRLVLHGVHRAVDFLRQLRLEGFEDLAEVRTLARVHVLLALFRRVRGEAFSGEIYGHVPLKKRMRFVSLKDPLCITKESPVASALRCPRHSLRVSFDAFFGVWRSLVARLLWEQDVACSNHATPTRFRSWHGPVAARSSTG